MYSYSCFKLVIYLRWNLEKWLSRIAVLGRRNVLLVGILRRWGRRRILLVSILGRNWGRRRLVA